MYMKKYSSNGNKRSVHQITRTNLLFSGDVFLEVVDGVESAGLLPTGAADPEPGAVEVPEGAGAHVGGEPGRVEVPRWVGVLHHVAVKARETLRERTTS